MEHRNKRNINQVSSLSDFRDFATSLDFKIYFSYIQITTNAIILNTIIFLKEEYYCKHL